MPFQPGRQKTGGRQKETPNKAQRARREEIIESGLTPLSYMIDLLRDETSSAEDRKWAAQNAAPYVHPKLAATTTRFEGELNLRTWLQSLGEPEPPQIVEEEITVIASPDD